MGFGSKKVGSRLNLYCYINTYYNNSNKNMDSGTQEKKEHTQIHFALVSTRYP